VADGASVAGCYSSLQSETVVGCHCRVFGRLVSSRKKRDGYRLFRSGDSIDIFDDTGLAVEHVNSI
jgi:hypothetical protein